MKSKTSCFNLTLFRSNWRRFWPVAAVVLGMVIFLVTLPLHGLLSDYGSGLYNVYAGIYSIGRYLVILTGFGGFGTAALLFRHLHSRRDIQFYHGLPVTRVCLYCTNLLSGLSLLLLPLLLGFGLTMLMAALSPFPGVSGLVLDGQPEGWTWLFDHPKAGVAVSLLRLLGVSLSAGLFWFVLAVLSCVLAGQSFGALLIFVGMNCVAAGLYYGFGALLEKVMPGIDTARNAMTVQLIVRWLTPALRMISAAGPKFEYISELSGYRIPAGAPAIFEDGQMRITTGFIEPYAFAVYGAAAILLAALAGYLYRIRPSEAAGDMVAFRPLRTVCKVLGALLICAVGALVTLELGVFPGNIPFWGVLLAALFWAAAGWVAAEMVVRKTLRVFSRKSLTACGVILAALILMFGAAKLDLFGRVRHVPEPSEVEQVSAMYNYQGRVEMDPADAQALHETVLAHRELLVNNGSSTTLELTYLLKNGGILQRSYEIALEPAAEENQLETLVREALSKPEYVYQTYFSNLPKEGVTAANLRNCSLIVDRQTETGDGEIEEYSESVALGTEDGLALLEAVRQDIQAGRVRPRGFWRNPDVLATFEVDVWTSETQQESCWAYIDLTDGMEAANAWVSAYMEGHPPAVSPNG